MIYLFSKYWKSGLTLGGVLLLIAPTFAEETKKADASKQEEKSEDDYWSKIKEHRKNMFFRISPTYFFNLTNQHHSAFAAQSFSSPANGMANFRIGFGERHHKDEVDTGWETALVFSQGEQNQNRGTNKAQYDFLFGGIYTGYDLLKSGRSWDLTLGSTLSYGSTHVEIFRNNSGGRFTERSLFWEPSLTISKKVVDHFRIGITTSYTVPFARSNTRLGRDLGVENVAPRGFSAGLDFVFGNF